LHLFHKINNDAVFIADAHYNKNRKQLDLLLNQILDDEIKTSQVIFMGDIFDFLSYEIKYFIEANQNIITLINRISAYKDVLYFEGNHDFNLKKIFFNVEVISRNEEFFYMNYNNTKVYISHGDIHTPILYDVFTKIFRNKYILKCLNMIDIKGFISKYFEQKLIQKSICGDFANFEKFASKRIEQYNISDDYLIIEGHFHQGKIYKNYINIPSLACANKYMQIQNNKFEVKQIQCIKY